MRPIRPWVLLGGYALAAILALVVVAPVAPLVVSSPASAGSPAPAKAAPDPFAQWDSWTVAQREGAYTAILSTPSANLSAELAAHGYSHATQLVRDLKSYFLAHPEVVLHPLDLSGFENALIGAGVGCVVGGFVGSFIPVVGTAAGCAVGAIATILGVVYLTQSSAGLGIVHEDGIVRSQVQAFDNAQNATTAFLTNDLSHFNATLYAWEDAADSEAVNQLGNSTFNYTLDLAQSGVPSIFDSVIAPYVGQTGLELANLDSIFYQIYSTPGLSNVHDYATFGSGACLGVCASVLTWYGGFSSFFQVGATSGQIEPVAILPYSGFSLQATGGTCALFNLQANATYETVASGHTVFTSNLTTASGGYDLIAASGATCELSGPDVIAWAPSPQSGGASTAIIDATCGHKALPGSCNVLNSTLYTNGQTPDTIQAFNSSGPTSLVPQRAFLGGVFYAYQRQFTSMIQSAESNAYVYWLFLRTLGYHSASAIPSGCRIPPPDLAVPPVNLANSGYTLNYTEAAYTGELEAMAAFFDTPLNSTDFCHGYEQSQFVLGNAAGPGLGENITGFVLTLPVGTHQKWKSPHTWAVNGSNAGVTSYYSQPGATNATAVGLTIWPSDTVYGYAIPLDTVVELPLNDPAYVDVTQTDQFYTLDGNGSQITSFHAKSNVLTGAPASTTPGAELYLTSCVIEGIAENPCIINGTSFSNATGNQSGGGPGPIFFLGSSPCGQTLPIWSTLVGVFAGLFGFLGSGLACPIGEFIAAVVLILVLVLIVYLIAAVVRRGGRSTSVQLRS